MKKLPLTLTLTLALLTQSSLLIRNVHTTQLTESPTPILQAGHVGGVAVLKISPDATIIASGGPDGCIKFWERSTGVLTSSLRAHLGGVNALSFSPDGQLIASGGQDAALRLWDVRTGRLIRSFIAHKTAIQAVTFNRDGSIIASASGSYGQVEGISDNTIRLWQTDTGQLLNTLKSHQAAVKGVAFNGRGDRLVSAGLDDTLKVWSWSNSHLLRTIQTKDIYSVAFSPVGDLIASAGSEEVIFWSPDTGVPVRTLRHEKNYSTDVVFTPDWKFVAIATNPLIIYDVQSQQPIRTLGPELGGSVIAFGKSAVGISNDGLFVVTGDYTSMTIWDAYRGALIHKLPASPQFTTCVAFSPMGDRLAWAYFSQIVIWDTRAGRLEHLLEHKDPINEVAFSPDGRTLASGSNSAVKLWSVSDGHLIRDLTTSEWGNYDGTQSVVFSPDGKYLAAGGWADAVAITVWSTRSWQVFRKFAVPNTLPDVAVTRLVPNIRLNHSPGGPEPQVHSLAFSPNSRLLASGDEFNKVMLWDVQKGKRLRTLTGHTYAVNSIAFNRDGSQVVSGSFDQSVKIWTVRNGQLVRTLQHHQDRVTNVKFSPEGQSIGSASSDGTVVLWRVKDGTIAAVLQGHDADVTSVAFSPDGRLAASTSLDGRLNIWSTSSNALISTIVIFPDHSWVNFAPDGYYAVSPNTPTHLAWRIGNKIYNEDSVASDFRNPRLLVSRFQGSSAPFVPPRIVFSPLTETRTITPIPAAEVMLKERWQNRRFFALVIGNNKHVGGLPQLENAVRDAEEIAEILEKSFGFKVTLKKDATRDEIVDALQALEAADEQSSILIYYAGHGTYKDIDYRSVGFWQPKDAQPDIRTNWISSETILEYLKTYRAAHVLVISDSCFSGTLLRGTTRAGDEPPEELLELMNRRSRTLVTSGGKQPVDDRGPGGHSVFGGAFINGLQSMPRNIFTMNRLFYEYLDQEELKRQTSQTPILTTISGFSGDNTGRFIFVKR